MTAFITKKSQAEELIRIWKATLLVEEALKKTLTPVTDEVAKLEGRTYFKYALPMSERSNELMFLLKKKDALSIAIDQEHVPFLQYLARQDALSKKYRQPIEHEFLIGFPSFYYRDRFGNEKLTSLFKFPLLNLEYPQISAHPTEGFQGSIVPEENSIKILQEVQEEGESGSVYWLDELFLEEELGVSDEGIIEFRRTCSENKYSPVEFLKKFCKQLLKSEEVESSELTESTIFLFLTKTLRRQLQQARPFSMNRQPARVFPYALVFELESNQPTRQLQNDLSDILSRDMLRSIKKNNHPAKTYLFGKNNEKNFSPIISAQYQPTLLTESQEQAIRAAKVRNFTAIKGPPGTGKTHIIRNLSAERLVQFANELNSPDDRITDLSLVSLVTSTNNRAVDNAIEGLDVDGLLPVSLRVGSRIVLSGTTSVFFQQYCKLLKKRVGHTYIKTFYLHKKELKEILEAGEADDETTGKKPTLSAEERYKVYLIARKVIDAWVTCNKDKILKILNSIIKDIEARRGLYTLKKPGNFYFLMTAFPLVGCTLLSLRNFFPMEKSSIGTVIVDEAGQCSPSYILPALLRSQKTVMIGDTMQLEPIAGLRMEDIETLREKRDIKISPDICRFFTTNVEGLRSSHHIAIEACANYLELKEHFRCQSPIIKVSMELCGYDLNVMTTNETDDLNGLAELLYLDVRGSEKRYGSSWVNTDEVNETLKLVKSLIGIGVKAGDIAILTPFRGQLNHINFALRREKFQLVSGESAFVNRDAIATGTVHRFQGGEKKIVLFSHVIAKGEPRFLNSRVNLLNVAVSRAQKHFIFVGSLEALSRGTYTALLKKHLIQEGEAVRI